MSLIDLLRCARSKPVSVVHEFKLYHDPRRVQIHAFVEGHGDRAFYSEFIRPRLSANARLYTYNCKGKRAVLDTMTKLRGELPEARTLLFFIDKDLDDLLPEELDYGEAFCTDGYSIENYVDEQSAVFSWMEAAFVIRGVTYDLSSLTDAFEKERRRFRKRMLGLMAWILAHRRAGNKPVLSAIDLAKIFQLDEAGRTIRRKVSEGYLVHLDKVTQVETTREILVDALAWGRLLKKTEPRVWLRGKFVVWFLVQFIRRTEEALHKSALEEGGSVKCSVQFHEENLVELLVPKIAEPARLSEFLNRSLSVLPLA